MAESKHVKVAGSERQPMPGAVKSGPADPNERLQVTVVLRSRAASHAPKLDELIARGEHVSREEYAARYGADPADVEKVLEFSSNYGLASVAVDMGARTVKLTGRAAAFSQAFSVELATYEHPGGRYRGRTGAVSVPQEVAGVIVAVHGLDNRPQAKAHFRLARATPSIAAAAAVSYTPLQIATAYDFPAGVNGKGQGIGIIELGGGYTTSDLKTYFSGLGVSPAPTVVAVSVDGAQNAPTGDTSGPDTEVMLDIEVAGAVAPGAKIAVYFAPNTDAGFLDAINQAAMDTTNKNSVLSISWGASESQWTAQSLQSFNSALQAAAAMGVTVCVAAGDNGSTDGETDGLDHTDFPCSSPYSLACGGTSLNISGGSISSEVVWNNGSGNGATGGGVSATFPLPSYQANASVPPSKNPGGFQGRGVPDVSGNADPETGYQVRADGANFVVGGTSAVAPLWAGLVALFNQATGKAAGFLNPTLYQNVAESGGAFHDITTGDNGDYSAAIGWDACTGWGSPDGAALLKVLSQGTTAPPPPTPPPPTPKPPPHRKHKHRH
jgi:kumamolisin